MLAAIKRCGSRVEFSLITVKATWPGLRCFKPSLREISLQFGGKIEETRTMLHAAMPALRRANSKLESLSLCLPTPFVRKIFFATNAMVPVFRASLTGLRARKILGQRQSNKKVFECQSISTPAFTLLARLRTTLERDSCRVTLARRGLQVCPAASPGQAGCQDAPK